jgi:phospholipase D1/2
MSRRDDDLAYGEYNEGQEGDRGLIGDMGRRFGFGKKEKLRSRMNPLLT